MKSIISSFRQNFLAGLVVIVPFGLTILVLFKLINWIVRLLSDAPSKFLLKSLAEINPSLFQAATVLIALLGAVLIVVVIGGITRNFLGKKLLDVGEAIISKIPFARTIYITTKQIIEAVFSDGLKGVKRVVLFEFPRKGIYSIGFVTGNIKGAMSEVSDKRLLGVYIPTSPNPTSGFYTVVPEDEVKELPLSVEDAFRIIISGGLSTSQIESFKNDQRND